MWRGTYDIQPGERPPKVWGPVVMNHYGIDHYTCHLLAHTLSQLFYICCFTEALQPACSLVPQLPNALTVGLAHTSFRKSSARPVPHPRNSPFLDSTSWTTCSFLCLFLEANPSPGIPCLSSAHSSGLAILGSAILPVLAWSMKLPLPPLATEQICQALPILLLSYPNSQHRDHPPIGPHHPK